MIIRVKVKLREQDTLREPRVFKVAAIYYPSNQQSGKGVRGNATVGP